MKIHKFREVKFIKKYYFKVLLADFCYFLSFKENCGLKPN